MPVDLSPGARVGRFVVSRPLGEGGMGTVVEARDPELGRAVALKLLRDERGDTVRLLREAQALATLSHPNVVAVYELGTDRGEVFIAMELVDGVTLDRVLGERPHPWREVVAWFVQAGRGLAAVHEAGLVHRDFKPSNLLVDRAGRVKVGDFGLACRDAGTPSARSGATPRRAAPMGPDDATAPAGETGAVDAPPHTAPADDVSAITPSEPGGMLATPLTQAGAVLGTPRYMAPEQAAGERVTHHADQYAFCVALDEALTGRRVPAWLRRLIDRGLARDPAARHPSLPALLDAIERGLRVRRAARIGVAVAAVTVASAAGAFWLGQRGPDPRAVAEATCAAGGERLDGAWGPARRDAVGQAFARAGAADVGPRVTAVLDGYAATWTAARIEACRATHVRREQSEALLDLRVQCLDRRRDGLAALAQALSGALDRAAIDKAVAAASSLPAIADCATRIQLEAAAPLPADPGARAAVERLGRALIEVDTLYKLARYPEARARLAEVASAAATVSYQPLASDLGFQRGWFAYRDGDLAGAEAAMNDALRAAVAARDLRREERAWRGLFIVVSQTSTRRAEAEQLRRADEVALERIGRPIEAWSEHRNMVVLFEINNGRLADAEVLARATVAEIPAELPVLRGVALDQHARVLAMLGRSQEVIAVAREAAALWERLLGPRHPKLASALGSLARAHRREGQLDDAAAALERSRDVLIAAHGPDSPHLADTYKELARLAAERRDLPATRRAAEALLRVLATSEQQEPENWINGQNQAGAALTDAGAPAEAVPYLRRGLARAAAIGDRKDGAIAASYLGRALNQLGEHREALARCVEAEPHMTERFGPSGLAATSHCRAEALLGLGRAAEAITAAEAAIAAAAGDDPDPGDLATMRFTLARARAARGDRAGARAAADLAAAEWIPPRFTHQRAALDAWRRTL